MICNRALIVAVFACGVGPLSLPLKAQEQAANICKSALSKDYLQFITTEAQQFAFLNTLDQRSFEELKKTGGAKFGISIPIIDTAISGSKDWNEYQSKKSSIFASKSYNSNSDVEIANLQIVTSPRAYDSFDKCMENAVKSGSPGIRMWKVRESEQSVLVRWYFLGAPGQADVPLDSILQGGSVDGAPSGKLTIEKANAVNNGFGMALIKRSGKESITAAIIAGGYQPDSIASEWRNAPPKQDGELQVTIKFDNKPSRFQQRSDVRTVQDNSNKRCEGTTCSPGDGKWRASITNFSITASNGNLLQNPRIECYGWPRSIQQQLQRISLIGAVFDKSGKDACAFMTTDIAPMISNEGKQATASIRTWSRGIEFALIADEYAPASKPDSEQSIPLIDGRTFTVSVPNDANSVKMVASTQDGSYAFEAGKSSPNGQIEIIGEPIHLPLERIYTYKFKY